MNRRKRRRSPRGLLTGWTSAFGWRFVRDPQTGQIHGCIPRFLPLQGRAPLSLSQISPEDHISMHSLAQDLMGSWEDSESDVSSSHMFQNLFLAYYTFAYK
jgi:hypothetical protein